MPAQIKKQALRVAIIGGGVSGSTTALYLAQKGIDVTLFEQGASLVNGPPMCHLHAGGNLYREISDQQCLTLLKESIEFARCYPNAIDARPTVVAIPLQDKGTPEQLLPRLDLLKNEYKSIIEKDDCSKVLGDPDHYFKLYSKASLQALAQLTLSEVPKCDDDWMIPVAQYLDLETLKFPLIMVKEYGINLFQVAASAALSIEQSDKVALQLNSKVTDVRLNKQQSWQVSYQDQNDVEHNDIFDYLINSCGFETGVIDDFAGFSRDRYVEFKAAYLTQWSKGNIRWPEIVFYGDRGSPQGMAQFTPYAGGYFQLHGMTDQITLFEGGLKQSSEESAYPELPTHLIDKVKNGWKVSEIQERTQRAISHLDQYIPAFESATVVEIPLFGIQQIPGNDPDLRATGVSFDGVHYARSEIVKASSVLNVAQSLYLKIAAEFDLKTTSISEGMCYHLTSDSQSENIDEKAKLVAKKRGFPSELAIVNNRG